MFTHGVAALWGLSIRMYSVDVQWEKYLLLASLKNQELQLN